MMDLVRIEDPAYISDFCNSDSHLLAYSLYAHYKPKIPNCELITCRDNDHYHTFVHISTDDGERFLDAHGIHDSLEDVVNHFKLDHHSNNEETSIEVIEPDNNSLHLCIKSSDRYQQYIEPLDAAGRDTYFSELIQSLALHYIWRVQPYLLKPF